MSIDRLGCAWTSQRCSVTIVDVRTLLRQIGTRYGIGIGLLVAVVLVIVVARVLPHTDAPPLLSNGAAAQSAPAVSPSAAAPLVSAAPTTPQLHAPVPPLVKSGARSPQKVARSFAQAWLHGSVGAKAWLRGVTAYSTAALVPQLAETDPANVPASRVTGDPTVVNNTRDNCVVKVPMDTGTLALTMTAVNGRWLVDGVDWDRAAT